MKSLWWKFLAIAILLYAVFAGMLVPLKPGITGVSPYVVSSGEKVEVTVDTYNAKSEGVQSKAYLKRSDDTYISANSVRVVNGKSILSFQIPPHIQGEAGVQPLTLLITDPENGTLVYPEGIQLKKGQVQGIAQWNSEGLPQLHKKKGFLFPYRNILVETIRNTFYHVSLWFAMFILFFAGMICSILYLRTKRIDYDHKASSLIYAGILMGVLGLITGSIWAKATWGAYWTADVKLNMSAISMLMYFAYWILRSSSEDIERKARVSSAYAIFAFLTIVPLIFVIPRITDSLHPGNGGNPALGGEDMDNTIRAVFYPAVIGFTLLGVWLGQILLRIKRLKEKIFFRGIDM